MDLNIKSFARLLLILICYVSLIFFNSPKYIGLGYDREIFQYIGMILNNDLLPYRDVFDHKPPIIYFINYIGFLITPNNYWGTFIIINLLGFIATLSIYKLSYSFLRNYLQSIFISILFIGLCNHPIILNGGNLTRQITLFFSTYILYLVFNNKKSYKNSLFIGALTSLIFFTQQNEILSPLVIIFYYAFLKDTKKINIDLKTLKNLTVGFLLISFFIITILVYSGNLSEFLKQAFIFNFTEYSEKQSYFINIYNIVKKIYSLTITNYLFLFTAIFIIINIIISNKIKTKIIFIAASALVAQIITASLSGKTYGHYFLMFIPLLTLLIIITFKNNKSTTIIFLVILVITLSVQIKNNYLNSQTDNSTFDKIMIEVQGIKNSNGEFYAFDASYLRVNYNLNIISPSKWVYSHFIKNDTEHYSAKILTEILSDLKIKKTSYVLINNIQLKSFSKIRLFLDENYKITFTKGEKTLFKIIKN